MGYSILGGIKEQMALIYQQILQDLRTCT